MRRIRPVTIYPPADLLNRVEKFAMAKDRPRSWAFVRLAMKTLDRIEKRKGLNNGANIRRTA